MGDNKDETEVRVIVEPLLSSCPCDESSIDSSSGAAANERLGSAATVGMIRLPPNGFDSSKSRC